MQALDLAIANFAVAEHLLHLEQLFAGAEPHQPSQEYVVKLCAEMGVPDTTAWNHLKNPHSLTGIRGSITIPSCLSTDKGLDFLLRQAVVVSCSALESFVWDLVRENALTVIKARGRRADDTLKQITLTMDDYLSLEGYGDPDERLRQIILKRYERGTLYDLAKIDEIMKVLTVRNLWDEVRTHTGLDKGTVCSQLSDLISRRNQIAHRADRPEDGTPETERDPHGLRPITHAWVNTRITNAKAFVQSAADAVGKAMKELDRVISQKEEQRLAQETLKRPEPKVVPNENSTAEKDKESAGAVSDQDRNGQEIVNGAPVQREAGGAESEKEIDRESGKQ
jgi:hypothetical protein